MTFNQAYAITVAIIGGIGIGLCASMIVAICYMMGLRGWPLLRKVLAALAGYHAWRLVWWRNPVALPCGKVTVAHLHTLPPHQR